ncbi:hypothetical protein AAHE18_11G044600 [Arachis hypogaea]
MARYGVTLALAILIIEMVINSTIREPQDIIVFEQPWNQLYYIANKIWLTMCIEDCNKQFKRGTRMNERCVKECYGKAS